MMVPMVARCFRLCRWYWLRDASVSASTGFYYVYTNGGVGYGNGASYASGVLPRIQCLKVTMYKGENIQRILKERATIRL
jgi:hypothetical protein